MERYIARVVIALLTFIIGVACGSAWVIHRYAHSQKIKPDSQGEVPIPSDTFISMERPGCQAECPSYNLAILADGTVIFSCYYPVKVNQTYRWKRTGAIKSLISQEQLRVLIADFEKTNYFSLRDSYRSEEDECSEAVTDKPTVYTSFQINGRKKSVEHYLGCKNLEKLTALEDRIDEILNTKQWIQ